MKKVILIILTAVVSLSMQAQKLNIQTALNALKSNDFAKAKQNIDEATANGSSTAKDGKAWLTKAFVYQAIGTEKLKDPKTGQFVPFIASINGKDYVMDLDLAKSLRPTTPDALETALNSFNRYLYYDKKADKGIVALAASSIAVNAYNAGIEEYKKDNYAEAMSHFDLVDKVNKLKNGDFWSSLPEQFAPFVKQKNTLIGSSARYKAYGVYNLGDDDASLPVLLSALKNPAAADDNIYLMIANIYKKKKDDAKYKSTIQEGLSKYPDSKPLQNEELNLFITGGDPDAAAKKLESAIAGNPSSPELRFNAGVMYDKLSQASKDAAKSAEYFTKAEGAYKKAIELDGSNSDYQFNLGALYFNKAKATTDDLNKEFDDAKYAVLKKKRDAEMALAMPFLEKAKSSLETKDLKDESNSRTYKNTLIALQSAYAILGKLEKAKAVGAILNKL